MDALASLMLQIEWGADEALLDAPVDRRTVVAAVQATPELARPTMPAAAAPPAGTAVARAQALADSAHDLAALERGGGRLRRLPVARHRHQPGVRRR